MIKTKTRLNQRMRSPKKASRRAQNEVLKFQRAELCKVTFSSFPLATGSKDCAVKCKIIDVLGQAVFAWGSSHREAFNNAKRYYAHQKDAAQWTII
ncbi:hypothetical protein ACT4RS_07455 [Ornithobacterium rhinotracheale]|uniref:hypothetical protein n=1 Tax=Ornithobacterium rhinotracheale TaxID=28251 RepID=UPI004035B9EA